MKQDELIENFMAETMPLTNTMDRQAGLIMTCLANYHQWLVKNCHIANVVDSKPNEKAALKHAVDAIYFADNSDYLSGLYGVVRSLTGLDEPTEEEINELFKELNTE